MTDSAIQIYFAGYLFTLTYAKTSDADHIITILNFTLSLLSPVASVVSPESNRLRECSSLAGTCRLRLCQFVLLVMHRRRHCIVFANRHDHAIRRTHCLPPPRHCRTVRRSNSSGSFPASAIQTQELEASALRIVARHPVVTWFPRKGRRPSGSSPYHCFRRSSARARRFEDVWDQQGC